MTNESILDRIIAAGQKGGWALALIVALVSVVLVVVGGPAAGADVTPLSDDKTVNRVVQELDVTPPLATAYDICQDVASQWGTVVDGKQVTVTGFQVAHIKQDDHFEGQLVQNQGQANQVAYHLFWRPDRTLQVIIEETRQGATSVSRTDPHLAQFDDCVATKKIQEISPKS